jgi:hypothetical protein
MCSPVRCTICGKTTWSGCGQHVDEVRATVPPEDWCDGHPDAPRRPGLLVRLRQAVARA